MHHGNRSDIFGRVIGMLVFLMGVALLLLVFYLAYTLFTTPPDQALGIKLTGDPKKDTMDFRIIGVQISWMLVRIGLLFIMSLAGSFVATKGSNLFFSALQGAPVGATGKSAIAPNS